MSNTEYVVDLCIEVFEQIITWLEHYYILASFCTHEVLRVKRILNNSIRTKFWQIRLSAFHLCHHYSFIPTLFPVGRFFFALFLFLYSLMCIGPFVKIKGIGGHDDSSNYKKYSHLHITSHKPYLKSNIKMMSKISLRLALCRFTCSLGKSNKKVRNFIFLIKILKGYC